MSKSIWINPKGGFANRAIQYLAAYGICKRVPQVEITNIHLPELGLEQPSKRPSRKGRMSIRQLESRLDLDEIERKLRDPHVVSVSIDDCWCQHVDNFPSREECRQIIPRFENIKNSNGFGPEYLVCSIRAAEILNGIHPGYNPLPPEYYKMLAAETGLDLVFYGQIGDDEYSTNLRNSFPEALFVESQGLEADFENLRNSTNIAIATSTFSWLAAWLSHANRIFLPVCGIFNQAQYPYENLLPLDDNAYEFTLFPVTNCVDIRRNSAGFFQLQEILARYARRIKSEELEKIFLRRSECLKKLTKPSYTHWKTRLLSPRSRRFDLFDNMFYAEKFSYLIFAAKNGFLTALRRYRKEGNSFGYGHLLLDEVKYLLSQPDSGIEISLGKYFDVYHHFLEHRRTVKDRYGKLDNIL